MMGSHGLWQKMMPYEEAVRVPLIFSAPFIKNGLKSKEAVSLLDIMPTVLKMTGADEIPENMQGLDLTELLVENKLIGKGYLFSEHRPLGDFHKAVNWRMVTDNEYKFVYNEGDRNEFYNMIDDPSEMNNLISDERQKESIEHYSNILKQWMIDTKDVIKYREN